MPKLLLVLSFILAYSVLGTSVVLAVDYKPLIEMPGMGATLDAQTYIRTLYIFAIGVAAFVAVGRLVLAGFTYVTSSIVTEKSGAKKDVTNAILGLIIILAATTILTTINPSISNLPALTEIVVPDPFKDRPHAEVIDPVDSYATPDSKRGILTDEELQSLFENEGEVLVDYLDFTGSISGNMEIREFRRKCLEEHPGADVRTKTRNREEGINTIGCVVPETSLNDTSTGEGTGSITYNGEEVDTSITYTINEPAIPSANIPAGEYHGQTGTIIGVTSGETTLSTGDGEPSTGISQQLILRLDDGTETIIPCGLIQPKPKGCH